MRSEVEHHASLAATLREIMALAAMTDSMGFLIFLRLASAALP